MDRIVAELLTQMDLSAKVGGIFVIGATNRPDLLDPSIMRPGRFDKQIYLGICSNKDDRIKILQAQTNKLSLSADVDFAAIVDILPQNLTGADFYGLTSKAVTNALTRRIRQIEEKKAEVGHAQDKIVVTNEDFLEASKVVNPSVTAAQLLKFEELKAKYS
jgi:peroxin-6